MSEAFISRTDVGTGETIPRRHRNNRARFPAAHVREPITGGDGARDRHVLVNGIETFVTRPDGRRLALEPQLYAPDVLAPDRTAELTRFTIEPWPTWTYDLGTGIHLQQEIFVPHQTHMTVLRWQILSQPPTGLGLYVRPFLSGRDYHALHQENPAFRFAATGEREALRWSPYPGVPETHVRTNGRYASQPHWYRNFLYRDEQDRGLDHLEDLAAPGVFTWDLGAGPAVLILHTERVGVPVGVDDRTAVDLADALARQERKRRSAFASPLHLAADAYLVRRGSGQTIVAGYPWFTDWGRDTFIALRGLCLATGRLDDARAILNEWSGSLSAGMLPNRFPDGAAAPEFNSVDASLWFIVAVHDFFAAADAAGFHFAKTDRHLLEHAVDAVLDGYSHGTRHGIQLDDDGLLRAGEAGVQLTWMDAKVGEWVVTPRAGKPVEVEALWLKALKIGTHFNRARWRPLHEWELKAFQARFWNPDTRGLHDVVDVGQKRGRVDSTLRPNQIFAVGGLPYSLLPRERARTVVDIVERELLTPLGLRSLSPRHPDYRPRYEGGVWERDGAYHQGTIWPWLLGPFVEAWVRVHGDTAQNRQLARERFLPPLLAHLDTAGLGQISEIADADAPFTPRGCPWQAWSLGELLRLKYSVLAPWPETPIAQPHDVLTIPAGGSARVRYRMRRITESARKRAQPAFPDFDRLFKRCIRAADAFYDHFQRDIADADVRLVQRQAFAGLIWSKQFYYFDVPEWLRGDPAQPSPPVGRRHGRNADWQHLNNADIISMPDKWEYPWYAAWDLAFHCVPFAMIDPEFAKEQLVLFTREWYMHPNGQLPAYEWDFGDVNPPVHAWATWRVFQIDRKLRGDAGDLAFLERVFHKLLLNFTWWVNRKDAQGRNVFQGGFLGLDNIGVSAATPTGAARFGCRSTIC